MGKKTKKGTKGQQTLFVSRKRAMRRLGLQLKDFRRICILKGVFPRQPNRKLDKAHRTYYHIKDIKFMMNDQLMDHLANEKIHKRRMKKAISKKDGGLIKKLKAKKPVMNVDHVVKQRFPKFEQALAELSDPLSLLSLLSSFPGHRLYNISPQRTRKYQMLMNMFKALVIKKNLLSKVFLSVKGVYYEAMLGFNSKVVWIEPYQSATVLPVDVDYKMLMTFSEFHSSLLKFVLLRLYTLSDVKFPPVLVKNQVGEDKKETTFGEFKLEKCEDDLTEGVDKEFLNDENVKKMKDWNQAKNTEIFANFVFFISREVKSEIFEFVAKSFGAKIIFEEDNFASESYKNGEDITHVITDRKLENIPLREKFANREFVQPQWIVDSINFNSVLAIRDYLPGGVLPPHLSPFEEVQREGFMPQREKDIRGQIGEDVDEENDDEEDYSEVSGDEEEDEEDEEEDNAEIEEKVQIEEEDDESDLEEEEEEEEVVPEVSKFRRSARLAKKIPVETVYSTKLKRNRLNVKKNMAYKVKEEEYLPEKEIAEKKRQTKKLEKEQKKLAVSQLSSKKRKIFEKLESKKQSQKEEVKVLKSRQKKITKGKRRGRPAKNQ